MAVRPTGRGNVTDWLANGNGGFFSNDAAALTTADGSWNIVGAGDVNGDGRAEIIWRNDNGAVTQWLANANGGFTSGVLPVRGAGQDWHLVSMGDYNGDHRADLLWQNDNGTVTNWLGTAVGGFVSNDDHLFASVPVQWHVQPTDIALV